MAEPRPTAGTPAAPPRKFRQAQADSDSDEHEDVEIELELPQHKIDELLAQLNDQDSSLKLEFPLAHVATVATVASGQRRLSSVAQVLGSSPALKAAEEWDPLAKLAHFKELQARYSAVKEQRERAESTQRILQQMPTAGSDEPPSAGSWAPVAGAEPAMPTPPEFPPAQGLPFPFCGVPGVLSPRAKAPPETEGDFTDGAHAYDAVKEILKEEGPSIHTRMTKADMLMAKDGMDMTLNHLRTTGARMITEVKELNRKLDEASNMAEIRDLAGNDPELQDELLAQQRMIHEQQRLADEARMELEIEKERTFWLRREKILQPEEVDDFKLEGDPVEYPPKEAEILGASRALPSGDFPAMRYMTPELAADAAGASSGPRSRYRMELPASREYHQRVAHQAATLGWPSPAEALPLEGGGSPSDRSPRSPREARRSPRFQERGTPISEPDPQPSPSQAPPESPRNFFAGFAEKVGQTPESRGFAQRGQPSSDDFDFDSDEGWSAVDARGRPLAGQSLAAAAFRKGAKGLDAEGRRPLGLDMVPPIAAFAGFQSRSVHAAVQPPPFAAFAGDGGGGIDFFGSSQQELTRSPREAKEEEEEEEEEESEGSEVDLDAEPQESSYFGALLGTSAPSTSKSPPSIDPHAEYMAGACMVRAPALEVPDFKGFRKEGLKSVKAACDILLKRRQEGRLGDPETARTALDYVVAVSINAQPAAEKGDAWKHVGIITDILHFFPLCAHIHLWSLEALMSLLRYEETNKANSLARPVFDSVTNLMSIHLKDTGLRTATPELPQRLLASIALSITPDNVKRLTTTHVEFALSLMNEPGVSPLTTDHGLQIVTLAAKAQVDLGVQARAARLALRCFRAEPRLVPRALLALSTLYMVAPKNETAASILEREPKPSDEIEGEDDMVPVGFRDITTTMDVYAKDRKTQGAGARALESALAVPGVSLATLARDGLLRSLTLAHQRCPQSRSVALSLCRVMGKVMLQAEEHLPPEVGISALSCGAALPRDAEVVVTSLEAVYVLAPKLRNLWATSSNAADRLSVLAGDLVRLGEVRHKDQHCVGMLLVILTTLASDGHGLGSGGVAGERWRTALGRAAAVAIPLRVFFEHAENVDMVTAAGICLRCMTYGSEETCGHAARARACPILLSTLRTYADQPATVRELLAALANCASMKSIKEDFQSGLPQSAEVIYHVMEQSSDREPDVLAQGCRAFGALYATANNEVNLGLKPGEKMKTASNLQWSKLNNAIIKTVIGITVNKGVGQVPAN